jgi:hypothetical protein
VHAHVLHHPYLEGLGLVVDPALSCLCCESCKVALVPQYVGAHVHKTHGCTHVSINNDLLAEACQRLEAASELPYMFGLGIKQQYAGLAVYDGIQLSAIIAALSILHCLLYHEPASYLVVGPHNLSLHALQGRQG